jgi:hypothetical protein
MACYRHPSLQTGLDNFYHPAFQSVVARWGLNPLRLSRPQAEQPLRLKPVVRVLGPFSPFGHASSLLATAQDVANASTHPFVGIQQGTGRAVFEVPKPSLEDRIDFHGNVLDAPATSMTEFPPQAIAELVPTLGPRPFQAATFPVAFEMASQEVDTSFLRSIHNPCFGGVQC